MVKYNYFKNLEVLSSLAEASVKLACGSFSPKENQEFPSLRRSSDRLICDLEDALFSDFLPPLERENIAACAHCLSRVIDQAADLRNHGAIGGLGGKVNEEGRICLKLAHALTESIAMLPRIRKPNETPDTEGFRALLAEGRAAHTAMLSKVRSGTLPRSAAQTIILTGKLRAELSRAFDELVEIMLNNI